MSFVLRFGIPPNSQREFRSGKYTETATFKLPNHLHKELNNNKLADVLLRD